MENKSDHANKVVIAICTYQRPNKLREALISVRDLVIPTDLRAHLVVVDNSPSEDVRSVFDQETKELPFSAEYAIESNRGIVHARNKALEVAGKNDADYIAFFDDDDYVDKHWLKELWNCAKRYSATVVSGRVRYFWPAACELSEDVRRVYDNAMSNMQTGTERRSSSTCNTLFDISFSQKHNLRFHLRLNLTGGEDSYFFESMYLLGAKIVWCEEAKVYSQIDPARANHEFVFRRRYNVGYTAYIIDSLLYGKLLALWKSFKYLIDIGVRTLFNLFRSGEKVRIRTRRRMNEAKGRIDAMLGKKFESYKESDGN
ncbi:glycosyltransferase family 2 protein [Ekhidna sp.]|uniref:glycosyltransferase family 2 protein n=1 Tax=Ekhidna sp. TaxID=2608089 RepID=UPI003CCB73C6